MKIWAFAKTSSRKSGNDIPEELRQVSRALIKVQGDVHEVFPLFYHLHPIVDYKIHFTFKNVGDFHIGHEKRSTVFRCAVQEGFQYPAPISSNWVCISKSSLRIRDSYRTSTRVPSRLTNSHKPCAHPVALDGLNAVVISAVPGAAKSSNFIRSSSARL